MSTRPEASTPRRRRRAPRALLVIVGILALGLVAAGAVVAVYVGGIARTVDNDIQRFDENVFADESLRPPLGGQGSGTTQGESGSGEGQENGSGEGSGG
ncbi:MAG: hypothetical protein Q4G34_07865, partial [Micrococcus sp.]|nr:hypothetical protein [Micrococcus sp.]